MFALTPSLQNSTKRTNVKSGVLLENNTITLICPHKTINLRNMKKDLILSSAFLSLLVIIVGLAWLLPVGAEPIIGSAKFEPSKIDLSLPSPSVVEAIIRFEEESVADINVSTILLEGSLPPSTTYNVSGGLVAEFNGQIVINIIWAKIYHIGLLAPPYKIWLTITGSLKETAGGTPFSAEGYIKIIVHYSPPPP
jgi:hypothetical protein